LVADGQTHPLPRGGTDLITPNVNGFKGGRSELTLNVARTVTVQKSLQNQYIQQESRINHGKLLLALCLQLLLSMKHIYTVPAALVAVSVMLCFATLQPSVNAQEKVVKQITAAEEPVVSPADKETIKTFNERVKQYVSLRSSLKAKAPKLSKDSTPEQIQAAETSLTTALRSSRAAAKPGDIFTPDSAQYIRATLKREFKPEDKKQIRKVVLEKESNIPVTLKVNFPYPDPKEFVEMPATLLLKLPPLPKELKYRYVGRNLLLVDTDNNMIVDYMIDALP